MQVTMTLQQAIEACFKKLGSIRVPVREAAEIGGPILECMGLLGDVLRALNENGEKEAEEKKEEAEA